MHPPIHIWTAPREPAYVAGDVPQRLIVERVTTLWDGDRLHERVERVREIAIAENPPAVGS